MPEPPPTPDPVDPVNNWIVSSIVELQRRADALDAISAETYRAATEAHAIAREAIGRTTQIEGIAWQKALDAIEQQFPRRIRAWWNSLVARTDLRLDNFLHNRWLDHYEKYFKRPYDGADRRRPMAYDDPRPRHADDLLLGDIDSAVESEIRAGYPPPPPEQTGA